MNNIKTLNNIKTQNNKSGFIPSEDKRIFSNTYLISFIILISLFFINF